MRWFLIGAAALVAILAAIYVRWAYQNVLAGEVNHHLVGIFGDAMAPVAALAKAVKAKRGSVSIYATARAIGTTRPTLLKLEQGTVCDIGVILKACRWLQREPCELVGFALRSPLPEDEVEF